jgi:CheY-like chemotaxis protein
LGSIAAMETHTPSNRLPLNTGRTPFGQGQRGKWLVVDDDPLMRAVIAEVLIDRANAAVVECDSGEVAWEAWKNLPDIEGVVTDFDMPGMDGLELAAKIHAERPELPILLVTACCDDLDWSGLSRRGLRRVLPKPFSCDELLSAWEETQQTTNWLAAA